MAGLLVSVRSPQEAELAIAGGADIVDIKEPTGGPLGMASESVIRDIVSAVAGRATTSVALGEWADGRRPPDVDGISLIKWGPRGLDHGQLSKWLSFRKSHSPVLVAYADAGCDQLSVDELVKIACEVRPAAFLIDTQFKHGLTLLSHLSIHRLVDVQLELARVGVPLALAGSIGEPEIAALRPVHPQWFAVRGAACVGGRLGTVCAERVRRLKQLVHDPANSPVQCGLKLDVD